MKFRHRLTPMALLALVALLPSCRDKATNPNPITLELNSGDIPNGGNFPHTFMSAGTYNYHCVHHSMSGSVIVSGSTPTTASVTIADNSYSPTPVSVGVNGTVTWHNTGTIHTVTSTP